jgi:hypothetical protein
MELERDKKTLELERYKKTVYDWRMSRTFSCKNDLFTQELSQGERQKKKDIVGMTREIISYIK